MSRNGLNSGYVELIVIGAAIAGGFPIQLNYYPSMSIYSTFPDNPINTLPHE